ncbi:MAG: serine hydrolase [Anaerolineae bacterium]|jgi:hypothetical protein|nr:serine hydrolase [Anaerolineae bacterium]
MTNFTLPRSTPEAQGVASKAILNYLDALAEKQFSIHSMMLLRHGNVIAEGWWQPYAPEHKRYVYSLSKSFTSSAVGFAVTEGLLTVEDKVIAFFPDDLPDEVSDNLAAMRLKDLLTMTTGHEEDTTTGMIEKGRSDWAKGFLSLPVQRKPGTLFVYNSGATYMLSAIVQKVTGQTVLDYLTPRLFAPLGITDITWETCPMGINTGGWGLSICTEDIAKFGQLYLQKGEWKDKQLLPETWVEEATAKVVPNHIEESDKDTSDWAQGYGYQFWRARHNAYRGDGAFGQYCLVMPDQDAVLVITSDTGDMQGILDLVWAHLLPAMQAEALPQSEVQPELEKRLKALALPIPLKAAHPANPEKFSGKTFVFAENRTGLRSAAFTFSADGCQLTLEDSSGLHTIPIGNGAWEINIDRLSFLHPTLLQLSMGVPLQEKVKFAAAGGWSEDGTYAVTLQYLETPHHELLSACFGEDTLTLEVHNSMVDPQNPMAAQMETVFTGTLTG